MGRKEKPLDPAAGLAGRFAAELRALRARAGNPSYRDMAARVHFSRSALAQAASGQALPTLAVLSGYVKACGGDVPQWETRWHEIQQGLQLREAPTPDSAFPYEPPADGIDPDAAGCGPDAITVHARRVATDSRLILGQVQLRYSPATGAAWCRFEGFSSLDHLATRQPVDIDVQVCRETDGTQLSYRSRYVFDYHWSDLLRTATGPLFARAHIYIDDALAATGESNRLPLP